MATQNGNDNDPINPWNSFDGLREVSDARVTTLARVLERAGPAVALAIVAPQFDRPLVQVLALALAGAIGIVQAAAELVRRTREEPHDPGTHGSREGRA